MIRKLKFIMLLCFCLFFFIGCLALPTRNYKSKTPEGCKLVTKKLKIKIAAIETNFASGCDKPECLLILIVPGIVSGTVSSSIVILNNTVHWIEKEGRCDNGDIKRAIDKFTNSLKKSGGWVVDNMKSLLEWMKIKKSEKNLKTVEEP